MASCLECRNTDKGWGPRFRGKGPCRHDALPRQLIFLRLVPKTDLLQSHSILMFWIVLRYLLVSSPRLPGGDVSVEVIMIGFFLVDASIMSMRQTRIIRHRHSSLNFHVPFPSLAPVFPPNSHCATTVHETTSSHHTHNSLAPPLHHVVACSGAQDQPHQSLGSG